MGNVEIPWRNLEPVFKSFVELGLAINLADCLMGTGGLMMLEYGTDMANT